MAFEHLWQRMVEFPEVDSAGIVHFSHYFRYMENAEHDFFRSQGLTIHDPGAASRWPRVSAKMDFVGPLRFEDPGAVHLMVERIGRGSLHYRCRIYNGNDPVRTAAHGSLSTVHCILEEGRLKAVPIADHFLMHIEAAPAEALTRVLAAPKA